MIEQLRLEVLEGVALDDRLSARIETLDQKFDRKADDLRTEMSKQFRWTRRTMMTLLGTMLTSR